MFAAPYFHFELPAPPLHEVADMFWSYEGYAPGHAWDRVLATSSVDLIFSLAGQPVRWRDARGVEHSMNGPVVCGPSVVFYDVPVDTQRRMGGIRLKPGGAWLLLGVSVDELAQAFVPLDALIGSAAREIDARLQATQGDQPAQLALLRSFVLERFVRSQVQRHDAVRRGLAELLRPVSIEALAEDAGLSHRRFIQLFRREVGLTPRDFRRVHRFHHVLPQPGIAAALDAGFFDQSHWALECRKLSGWTPSLLTAAHRDGDVLPREVRGQMLPILPGSRLVTSRR